MISRLFRTEGDFYLFADWLAVVLLCYYFRGCLKVKEICKLFLGRLLWSFWLNVNSSVVPQRGIILHQTPDKTQSINFRQHINTKQLGCLLVNIYCKALEVFKNWFI